ncbi:aminoglycoside phosphotransferase family protein [Streptomyces sp. TRM49041]|uniref:phosphotransferase family protein n=1 Tax=Streptomyces sp. TRM49041 TaxID=2603216 RepID=UPI0011EED672|nr:aminoglycoside phosphotransferase family protein [Streptomyces sp. TRM49041]
MAGGDEVLNSPVALRAIESRHGPFRRTSVKPYSRVFQALDGRSLLKVYIGIDPAGRRSRELEAIRGGCRHGLSVPTVLGTGFDGESAWTVFQLLPGRPCTVETLPGLREYLDRILALSGRLHRPVTGLAPGPGWMPHHSDPFTQRGFLLRQLSPRCRLLPWWAELAELLAPIDSHPVVRLHGDLKPEHLLVDGDWLHVVDWEASGRGPAVADHADVAFHLARDLIYGGLPHRQLPEDVIRRLVLSGSVLAWRLLLWLDRRRPEDITLVPPGLIRQLAALNRPIATWALLAQTISSLRARGVPR